MKELRKAWRTAKGPVWFGLNALKAAVKQDVLNKLAERKKRSKLGRKGLIWMQRAHAVGWGLLTFGALQVVLLLLAPTLPISAGLFVAAMYWAGAGDDA